MKRSVRNSKTKRRKNEESREWQIQEAKARFSELFRLARESGPQRVTKHGREAVVVLPAEEYERLSSRSEFKEDLANFLARSPLAVYGVEFHREKDFGRDIDV